MNEVLNGKRWRRLGWAATSLSITCLLAGTSALSAVHAAPAHATTTLVLWSGLSGPDQTGFVKIVDGFNASQNAVQISYDQQSFNGYGPKLATALSAGKGPNLWTDCAACSANYMAQNQMTKLDSLIKSSKILNKKNFAAPVWNNGTYQGHLELIPLDTVPLMMYYNKALLKQAGLKAPVVSGGLSKIVAAAKKLTKGGNQYGMVIPTDWPMQFLWPTMLAQFGGKAYDPKTHKAVFNSKAGVQALTTLRNLIYKYNLGPKAYAVDQDIKLLANGGAAQVFDGIWQWTNPSLRTLGNNEGISVVPQFGPKKAVFVGDLYFAVYKNNNSAEDKAAIKFLEYYQTHSIEMAKVGDVPVYKPLFKSPLFKTLTAVNVGSKELKYGVLSPPVPNYDDHWLYDDALWPILRGQSTDIQGDLNKAADAVNNHLANPSG